MDRFFGPNWRYSTPSGEMNFHGAVKQYFEVINEPWKEYVKDEYYTCYINRIFPVVRQSIALKDYSYTYISEILKTIQDVRILDDQTIKSTYRHLVIDPYEMYLQKEHLSDLSWGMSYKLTSDTGEKSEEMILIPKSLTPKQIEKAKKYLLQDYTADGKLIGLALMLFIGARENEICGANFSDIREFKYYPGNHYIVIGHRTTELNSNQLKAGGKTLNSPRLVPLSPVIFQFLKCREKYVSDQIGEDCQNLPIACRQDRFTVRCSTQDLSLAGMEFFRDVLKLRERILSAVSLDIEENESKDFDEKDPTTYLFRRNFATNLYIHDLTIEECQYLMGHEIENPSFRRHDFIDENLLFRIVEKLGFTAE